MAPWTRFQAQLATLASPQIGSIYYVSDAGEPVVGRLAAHTSGVAEAGPSSTTIECFAAAAGSAIGKFGQDAKVGAKAFRDIVLKTGLFGSRETLERFPLRHMDLEPQNILVDSNFNVVAIIDWEFAQFAPWQTNRFPIPFPLLGLDIDDILRDPTHLAYKNVLPQRTSQALYLDRFRQAESEVRAQVKLGDKAFSDILHGRASRIYACFTHLGWLPIADAGLVRQTIRLAFGLQEEDAEEYIRDLEM